MMEEIGGEEDVSENELQTGEISSEDIFEESDNLDQSNVEENFNEPNVEINENKLKQNLPRGLQKSLPWLAFIIPTLIALFSLYRTEKINSLLYSEDIFIQVIPKPHSVSGISKYSIFSSNERLNINPRIQFNIFNNSYQSIIIDRMKITNLVDTSYAYGVVKGKRRRFLELSSSTLLDEINTNDKDKSKSLPATIASKEVLKFEQEISLNIGKEATTFLKNKYLKDSTSFTIPFYKLDSVLRNKKIKLFDFPASRDNNIKIYSIELITSEGNVFKKDFGFYRDINRFDFYN